MSEIIAVWPKLAISRPNHLCEPQDDARTRAKVAPAAPSGDRRRSGRYRHEPHRCRRRVPVLGARKTGASGAATYRSAEKCVLR
jgi:hypothetical protein